MKVLQFFINTRSGVPLYRQIFQQVEKGIRAGILSPGEQLPTVRDVAMTLTVNPNTVARAYRELEHDGLIESVQGRGTFISEAKPSSGITGREEIIRQHLDNLLVEARQLKIGSSSLDNIFKEYMERYRKENRQGE